MICPTCNDTGEAGGYGVLDCSSDACAAATERAALNAHMAALPLMTQYDHGWQAYQLGRQAVQAELHAALFKMWGWAIELDEARYFSLATGTQGKAEWKADTDAAKKLYDKYKSKI